MDHYWSIWWSRTFNYNYIVYHLICYCYKKIKVKVSCHITIKKRKKQSLSSVTYKDVPEVKKTADNIELSLSTSYDTTEHKVYENITGPMETDINMSTNVAYGPIVIHQ